MRLSLLLSQFAFGLEPVFQFVPRPSAALEVDLVGTPSNLLRRGKTVSVGWRCSLFCSPWLSYLLDLYRLLHKGPFSVALLGLCISLDRSRLARLAGQRLIYHRDAAGAYTDSGESRSAGPPRRIFSPAGSGGSAPGISTLSTERGVNSGR